MQVKGYPLHARAEARTKNLSIILLQIKYSKVVTLKFYTDNGKIYVISIEHGMKGE
jgi:hypothetical protein